MNALTGAVLGAVIVAGIALLVLGLQRVPQAVRPPLSRAALRERFAGMGLTARNVAIGAAVGLVAALVSGLPVLVILGGMLGFAVPSIFGTPASTRELQQAEAVETWTRGLAGVLESGSGIEDALRGSLRSTPELIRPQVARLVARLNAQQPLQPALRAWADDMNNRVSDLVAATLLMGYNSQQGGVARALEDLSASVSEQTRTMQRIEAERSGTRTAARLVTGIMLAMFMVVLASDMGNAYRAGVGQLVLLLIGAAFTGAILRIGRLAAGQPRARFLTSTTSESRREEGVPR